MHNLWSKQQQVLIMSTYYAAQLGIALSVVDSKASYIKEEEGRKRKQLLDESIKTDIQQQSIGGADVRHRRFNNVEG